MRNMDLAALQIFKAVADEGGITKAAAKLGRVQSNITTRVKQLEARLETSIGGIASSFCRPMADYCLAMRNDCCDCRRRLKQP